MSPQESPLPEAAAGVPSLLSFDTFEKISKVFVVFVAVLYGLGLLVTNQYLLSLGVSDFSSLKPKYVITGAWTLALMVIDCLPALFVFGLFRSKSSILKRFWLRITIGLIGGIGFALLARAFLYYVITLYPYLSSASVLQTPNVLKGMVIGSSVLGFILLFRIVTTQQDRRSFWGMTSFVGLYGVLVLSTAIGTSEYPRVPEAWGGGRPLHVSLVLNETGIKFWRVTGAVPPDKDSMRTPEIEVLYQNDHEMLISAPCDLVGPLPDGGHRVEKRRIMLNKSLVDGILPKEDENSR